MKALPWKRWSSKCSTHMEVFGTCTSMSAERKRREEPTQLKHLRASGTGPAAMDPQVEGRITSACPNEPSTQPQGGTQEFQWESWKSGDQCEKWTPYGRIQDPIRLSPGVTPWKDPVGSCLLASPTARSNQITPPYPMLMKPYPARGYRFEYFLLFPYQSICNKAFFFFPKVGAVVLASMSIGLYRKSNQLQKRKTSKVLWSG
ncbi:uncharacterized protein [Gorilla gorilla gorilla]|uniref:uncharacterized protein n=1 Tax=Gorilla gorilla gorilla TaxID=9595 RepID=UPI002445EB67|nr:uncharacterized protein LOC129534230 [Gorilla gorilla gorilla]